MILVHRHRIDSAAVGPGFRLYADTEQHEDGEEQQLEIVFIFQENIVRHFEKNTFMHSINPSTSPAVTASASL